MSLWRRIASEAHNRSIWQVFAAYLVTSWIIYQVVLGLYEGLGLPRWVPPLAILLLLIGLPIVLLTAFVQRGGPSREALLTGGIDPTLHPEFETLPARRSRLRDKLTWRRSLLSGAIAFAVLALVTAIFMAMRTLGFGPGATLLAQGVIAEDDKVVLADFSSTADSALGRVVAEALRIDLQQSNVIRLAAATEINAELRRMLRDPGAIDEATAREIAQRAGFKAVVAGEVGQLGSGYTLNARLITPDGNVLAAFREPARDSTELVGAVERLSRDLREKIGESLKSIRAGPALAKATTSSLPALRKYTEAVNAVDQSEIARLAEEAIALDSMFAMAYRRLAVALSNLRIEQSRQIEAATRAYELRDRLPEIERYHTIAWYESNVRGDLAESVRAYERLLAIDSLDAIALNNIALRLNRLGEYVQAERYVRRALDGDGIGAIAVPLYGNLLSALYGQGKRSEALKLLDRGASEFPGSAVLARGRLGVAIREERWTHADSTFESTMHRLNTPGAAITLLPEAARMSRALGQLAKAAAFDDELQSVYNRQGLQAEKLVVAATRALAATEITDDTAAAVGILEAALRETPLDVLDPFNRPYLPIALAYARAGRDDPANQLIQRFESEIPPGKRGLGDAEAARVKAVIALNRGDAVEAVPLIRASVTATLCRSCIFPDLANAFDQLNQPDSARFYREAYLNSTELARFNGDAELMPKVLLRLAQHYENTDPKKAIAFYTRFIDRWKDADAVLQPRVRAAQARRAVLLKRAG